MDRFTTKRSDQAVDCCAGVGRASSRSSLERQQLEDFMKKFVAIYLGTPEAFEKSGWNALTPAARKEKEAAGIDAWMNWCTDNRSAIVDIGTPLGKTKRISSEGVADTRNALTGYVIVQAESHEAAAKLFQNHPHFTIFPGEAVEIMECLPLPGQ
jgi:hypothetical protein